jgi:hypothetical protein
MPEVTKNTTEQPEGQTGQLRLQLLVTLRQRSMQHEASRERT